MGRRSINTTKSGKYMNPTDQARKEARKKELKKNKKQRQMVRAAVLKMKDPHQILDELEKIDEMEYNVLQPSPLNEKVLKEKRKKLKETFDRVLKMYDKDEPEKWVDLKRQEMDYEKKRSHLISYYESVKHAQSVQLDDIPLPTAQLPENQLFSGVTTQIPLPSEPGIPQPPIKPILKKDSAYKERPSGVEPPGVPPGPPPDFMNLLLEHEKEHIGYKDPKCLDKRSIRFIEDEGPPGETVPSIPQEPENFDGEELDHVTEPPQPPVPGRPAAPPAVTPKPTSLQQRMLALSGQNIDDFMKEMEEVHKKRERDRAADLNARLSALKRKDRPLGGDSESDSDSEMPAEPPQPPPVLASLPEPPGTVPLMPPQPISVMQSLMSALRPPPLRAPMGPPPLRMPPGPPPGRPGAPPGPPPGLPPRAILRPPGPPPGAPPRLLRPLVPPPPQHKPQLPVSVLTAAPMLLPKKDGAQGATISAKPQIRNLSADVTRFVPSALRVKREDKKMKPGVKPGTPQRAPALPKQAPTKDDAYMQFMREMEGLL